jgi:hypothetical protein
LGKLEEEPEKMITLEITILNNKKKRLRRNEGLYFKKHALHLI